MQEEIKEVDEDIGRMQQKIEGVKEEEKRVLMDGHKTQLTVENLPSDASEPELEGIFGRYPGLKAVYVNQPK